MPNGRDQRNDGRYGEGLIAKLGTTAPRRTVQHAGYEWGQHRKEYSDGHYTLAIAAYKRWARKVQNIPIAVVVRLEDLGRKIPIYVRVRASIEVET